MVKFFIDPGHGGIDSGAVGNDLQEKNLTLQISKNIRDILNEYENVQVKLSREGDETLSLTQRTDAANSWRADFLLSVHINSGGGTGFEDYIYPTASSDAVKYQNVIHAEIKKEVDFQDRGKKKANFHMIRESKMPSILTENGFIDHPSDAAKLKQQSYIERIALGHVNGLVRAFNLQEKEPKPPMWDGLELHKEQIGRIRVLKRINLWKRDANDQLVFVRILQPGEVYRVYGYDDLYFGQYDVGDNHWITKIDGYIKYETPSKALLKKANEFYQ
ncbi:N-acetylmuramoyl-L-alanine amidase [Cytobacillus praedii]|uniref:N-acetylmuramoyl-L-alanine amidase n=1 Tax=Cytobacillus praedii TaxID=1742358 RepID=UPI003F7E5BD3